VQARHEAVVSDEAQALFELMSAHGSDVDSLGARSGLEVGRVISLLVELQLAGLVLQKGGGRFERKAGGPRAHSIVDLAGASN
jgi:predicted Rossmann fold nucleotide-binding protein DprA/Smf involved in DNA uptake